jgi:hypothetical protein
MIASRKVIGLLGILIAVAGTVGCDKDSIVVDRSTGVSGTITNNMPYADAKALLLAARAKELVGWNKEGTGPLSNRRFELADGSPFELSVEKTTELIKTIKYCDAATVKRRPEWWRWHTLTLYRMEKSGENASQPGVGR